MKAVVILGCEGRQIDSFHFCNGIENIILDLEKAEGTKDYVDLVEYLDAIPKLFERPCCVAHKVSNAVYKIYEMGYIEEKTYEQIAHFYDLHKRCGIVLKIEPKYTNISDT